MAGKHSAERACAPGPVPEPAGAGVPDVTIVVPTRNEEGNVASLLDRLARSVGNADIEVLFVDDSDDATPAAIERAVAATPFPVRLIHRPRKERSGGLGGAVVAGMRESRATWVLVMDADLQHPPEDVARLLTAATDNVDLVVASRYLSSGNADGLSSGVRKAVSHGSGGIAHLLFPRRLASISDPMSGFFMVRRSAVDVDALRPSGFKILLDIVVRTRSLRVTEVPFDFARRDAGESKASMREGFRFVGLLAGLRAVQFNQDSSRVWQSKSARMVGMGAIGASGIIINTLLLGLFVNSLGLKIGVGAALATEGSTTWNFLLIDAIVYRTRTRGAAWKRFLGFLVVNNLLLLLRIPALHFLVGRNMNLLVANVLTLVALFLLRFLIADRAIYRQNDPEHVELAQLASGANLKPSPHTKVVLDLSDTDVPTPLRSPRWLDFRYQVQGLCTVASQVPLKELEHFRVPAVIAPADIEVRIGPVGGRPHGRVHIFRTTGGTVYEEHLGKRGASFRVETGDRLFVTVCPLLGKSPHVLYTNIIEALLRFVAVSRGRILLHSACLELDGRGVMLSARTDTGKTGTILRLLRDRGAHFLSDDMTIVDPDGQAYCYPKPLTISQHTLRAVEADDLTKKEWRRLRLQSRLHSKEGRGIGLWLARSNLPIMAMNSYTQRLVPPPKYTAGRLVPCETVPSVHVSDLFIIERGHDGLADVPLEDAVDELIQNTDDAYGFPPFADFAPLLNVAGMSYSQLRDQERLILEKVLSSGIRVRRLGSNSFGWADQIPDLLSAAPSRHPADPDRAIDLGGIELGVA